MGAQEVLIGLLGAFILIALAESIKNPKASTIQVIMLLGKPYKAIANVPGKKVFKDWILKDGEGRKFNLYFFLWPIFTTYSYDFAYTKIVRLGAEKEGDIVIWKDESSKLCVIYRRGKTKFVRFRHEYPVITPGLDTQDMGTVNTLTNNMIEAYDIRKMLFGINDYLSAGFEMLNGVLRGLVSSDSLYNLNQLSSTKKNDFNRGMIEVNHPLTGERGFGDIGMILFGSIFKDFEPANKKTEEMMASYADVTIFEQKGIAALKKQEGETLAYQNKTLKEIELEKKRRIDIGIAKKDAAGNIIELVPEANVKIVMDNFAKMKNLQTLSLGGDDIVKMLTLNKS